MQSAPQHYLVGINYTDQWKHSFTVKCVCGWQSRILGDSTRRLSYRDPWPVAIREMDQHKRCEKISSEIRYQIASSGHPLENHSWQLLFENSIENHYCPVCSCGWRNSGPGPAFVKVAERTIKRDTVRLRKIIRAHTMITPTQLVKENDG